MLSFYFDCESPVKINMLLLWEIDTLSIFFDCERPIKKKML